MKNNFAKKLTPNTLKRKMDEEIYTWILDKIQNELGIHAVASEKQKVYGKFNIDNNHLKAVLQEMFVNKDYNVTKHEYLVRDIPYTDIRVLDKKKYDI